MTDFYFLYSIIYLFYIHFREKKDLICLYVGRIKKVVTPPPRKINDHVLTEGISQMLTIFLSKAKRLIFVSIYDINYAYYVYFRHNYCSEICICPTL